MTVPGCLQSAELRLPGGCSLSPQQVIDTGVAQATKSPTGQEALPILSADLGDRSLPSAAVTRAIAPPANALISMFGI